MDKYLCKSCKTTISYGENNICLFCKYDNSVYSTSKLEELDEMVKTQVEEKDEFATNLIENSRKLYPAVEDNEESDEMNFLLINNSEQVSFKRAPERKRNYSTPSDEPSKNLHRGNLCDSLHLSSVLNVPANLGKSRKNTLFKASTENFEKGCRTERSVYKTKKKNSGSTKVPFEQSKRKTCPSTSLDTSYSEQCEISPEESKRNSLTKDKDAFLKDLESATHRARSGFKSSSETSFPVNSAISRRNKESDDDVTVEKRGPLERCISHELVSEVHNRSKGATVNVNFDHENSLKMHAVKHKSKKRFACDVCNKGFSQRGDLAKHELTHSGKKPFECDVCNKRFTQKVSLKRHEGTHSGKKPFKCNVCKKEFSREEFVTRHERIHTGEKPFACDVCNKRFTQKVNLKRHEGTHSEKKPFQCYACKKRFYRKDYLAIHDRIHTGEKSYKCDLCKKDFSRKDTLTRHEQTHSGEKRYM